MCNNTPLIALQTDVSSEKAQKYLLLRIIGKDKMLNADLIGRILRK